MRFYEPMLVYPSKKPFSSPEWIYEIKWDGIRAISYVKNEIHILSRNRKELSVRFPELEELKQLAQDVVLDGELIIMGEGVDFQKVLERNQATDHKEIDYLSKKFPVTYVVFDLLEKDGRSLLNIPLIDRKRILRESLKEGKYVVISIFVEEDGEKFYRAAIEKGLEGIIAKRRDSRYFPGKRSREWLKIKQVKTCDCVVFGYTKGEGNRRSTFGSLLLGVYDNEIPVYLGRVGTGFSLNDLKNLKVVFKDLISQGHHPFDHNIPVNVTWLKPNVVVRIGYQSITKDRRLRFARYMGVRNDKSPKDCTIDQLESNTLRDYVKKRDFSKSPEPKGKIERNEEKDNLFVIQEHNARRLHYDLRLEKDGVLKSWALPKGIPKKRGIKRLAIHTEDHPIEYSRFEGTIPKGEYGAGEVKIWDQGLFIPLVWDLDKIELLLVGSKIKGRYVLIKFKKAGDKEWLLFKKED
jgi:DNA ligase D-like protein (predicted ligase)/DNA ligase D-like protein (predicted 3'-phosphoesterase)